MASNRLSESGLRSNSSGVAIPATVIQIGKTAGVPLGTEVGDRLSFRNDGTVNFTKQAEISVADWGILPETAGAFSVTIANMLASVAQNRVIKWPKPAVGNGHYTYDPSAVAGTPTGTTDGTTTVSAVSSFANIQVGMVVQAATGDIPAGTTIAAMNTSLGTITLSNPASGSHVGQVLTVTVGSLRPGPDQVWEGEGKFNSVIDLIAGATLPLVNNNVIGRKWHCRNIGFGAQNQGAPAYYPSPPPALIITHGQLGTWQTVTVQNSPSDGVSQDINAGVNFYFGCQFINNWGNGFVSGADQFILNGCDVEYNGKSGVLATNTTITNGANSSNGEEQPASITGCHFEGNGSYSLEVDNCGAVNMTSCQSFFGPIKLGEQSRFCRVVGNNLLSSPVYDGGWRNVTEPNQGNNNLLPDGVGNYERVLPGSRTVDPDLSARTLLANGWQPMSGSSLNRQGTTDGGMRTISRSARVPVSVAGTQINFTGTTNATTTVSSVSSFNGLTVGAVVTAADIPGGTTIAALAPTLGQLTLSAAATGSNAGEAMSVPGKGATLTVPNVASGEVYAVDQYWWVTNSGVTSQRAEVQVLDSANGTIIYDSGIITGGTYSSTEWGDNRHRFTFTVPATTTSVSLQVTVPDTSNALKIGGTKWLLLAPVSGGFVNGGFDQPYTSGIAAGWVTLSGTGTPARQAGPPAHSGAGTGQNAQRITVTAGNQYWLSCQPTVDPDRLYLVGCAVNVLSGGPSRVMIGWGNTDLTGSFQWARSARKSGEWEWVSGIFRPASFSNLIIGCDGTGPRSSGVFGGSSQSTATMGASASFTGTTNATTTVTAVAATGGGNAFAAGVAQGQPVSGTDIPAGTKITATDTVAGTITLSNPATGSHVGAALTSGSMVAQAVDALFDDMIFVPLHGQPGSFRAETPDMPLSTAATVLVPLAHSLDMRLRRVTAMYSVASDANTGVTIRLGITGNDQYYATATSLVSQPQGTEQALPIVRTDIRAGTALLAKVVSAKTGTGTVRFVVEADAN